MLLLLAALLTVTKPDGLAVPMDATLALAAKGQGVQVYRCQAGQSGYAWTLEGPDAKLFDPGGHLIGRHYAGPTWQAADGSTVKGRVLAKAPSPSDAGVDWLLLAAAANSPKGEFSRVSYIKRVKTTGGVAPESGCDAARGGANVRVPYSAEYDFYLPSKPETKGLPDRSGGLSGFTPPGR